ncbi:hypothetical protein EWI61_02655 [Methylolobus aquaticus]|nr:hypothetical protein EWI61_02655 [Methylolobus aquaticus]
MTQRTRPVLMLAALMAGLLSADLAQAISWFDSSSTPSVMITSNDFHAATQLRRVTVVCPKAGNIVANATSQFGFWPAVGGWTYVGIGFSIAINDAAPTAMHSNSAHYVAAWTDGMSESGATQRIAPCTAGQTMDVYFMGYLQNTETGATAFNPTLVVQFFDTRI